MSDWPDGERPRASLPPPMSPCIRVCHIDASRGLCTGCLRTLPEITAWRSLGDAAQREILAQLPGRRGAAQN